MAFNAFVSAVMSKLALVLVEVVIIESAVEFASAQRGLLILRNADNQLCVEAEFSVENGISNSMQSLALEQQSLPLTLLNYVIRSHESVVIHDAQQPSTVVTGLEVDTYIQSPLPHTVGYRRFLK